MEMPPPSLLRMGSAVPATLPMRMLSAIEPSQLWSKAMPGAAAGFGGIGEDEVVADLGGAAVAAVDGAAVVGGFVEVLGGPVGGCEGGVLGEDVVGDDGGCAVDEDAAAGGAGLAVVDVEAV